jgi:hypothetical protein
MDLDDNDDENGDDYDDNASGNDADEDDNDAEGAGTPPNEEENVESRKNCLLRGVVRTNDDYGLGAFVPLPDLSP